MGNLYLKSVLRSGLILGGVFSLHFLCSTAHNILFSILTYAAIGFIIVMSYRLPVSFRDNENEGVISFGAAFLYVLLSFFIASFISFVIKVLFFSVVNPDYLLLQQSQVFDTIEAMKISFDEEQYRVLENMFQPVVYASYFFIMNMFFAVIFGLIIATFVKKEKSIFDN
ncbi:MAG: DUF4199 domain-containing protein [Prevotellaceae bacterium]|jgi:hypothetical protein|nr:DUF4199 domain-containing protein [Prevotellaceae bacterium]